MMKQQLILPETIEIQEKVSFLVYMILLYHKMMKKHLDEIGEEPTDGISIISRLPDASRVTRKFNENAPLKACITLNCINSC